MAARRRGAGGLLPLSHPPLCSPPPRPAPAERAERKLAEREAALRKVEDAQRHDRRAELAAAVALSIVMVVIGRHLA